MTNLFNTKLLILGLSSFAFSAPAKTIMFSAHPEQIPPSIAVEKEATPTRKLPGNFRGHALFQLGGAALSSQGKAQHIHIQDLVGNGYSVNNHQNDAPLFGFGYFIEGLERPSFTVAYGLNAFYLPNTSVSGVIKEEEELNILSYKYKIAYAPLYAAVKAMMPFSTYPYALVLDAGIGPNWVMTDGYREQPLDNITIPDDAFLGHTSTTFSATAGVGLRVNLFSTMPLECGYRFMYLGQGELQRGTDQYLNTIKTGHTYANGILCGLTI